VDLGEAGESHRQTVAIGVVGDLGRELAHEVGALGAGTDQRHVAPEDVPELGQLVQAQPTEPPAHPGLAGVVVDRPGHVGVRVDLQGAELQHFDLAAVLADAPLAEQDRPGAAQPHRQGQESEEGRQQHEEGGRDDHVHDPLGLPGAGAQRGPTHLEQRDPPDVLDVGTPGGEAELEEPGHHVELDVVQAGGPESRDELLLTAWAERDEDPSHVPVPDDRLEVGHAAQEVETRLRGDVVDEADRHQPVLGVLVEQTGQFDAHGTGADDDGVLLELPGAPGGPDHRVRERAPHDHGDARDRHLVEQRLGQIGERRQRAHHEERDAHAEQQAGQLGQGAQGQVATVGADHPERDEHGHRVQQVGPADARDHREADHDRGQVGDDAQRPRAERLTTPPGACVRVALAVDGDERAFDD